MRKIPVIALKNKIKENRFLAANMDVGDWDDPELDVALDDIGNAFLIWRKDLTKPTDEDVESVKNAIVSYDVEEWLKHYEPVNLEISEEQFEVVNRNADL